MKQIKPKHIAIIMDGNRRWAREKGIPSIEGHWEGYRNMKRIAKYCLGQGISHLTVWAFSTENWDRPKTEIRAIIKILRFGLQKEIKIFHKEKIKLNFIGRLNEFPADVQKLLAKAMKDTAQNACGQLNVALNYGGRAEIIDAVKKIVSAKLAPKQITEAAVSNNVYTAGIPDSDLIIRTSGEQRLSGFLPWQGVHSELLFSKKTWPAFTEKDFDAALLEFSNRKRTFGK